MNLEKGSNNETGAQRKGPRSECTKRAIRFLGDQSSRRGVISVEPGRMRKISERLGVKGRLESDRKLIPSSEDGFIINSGMLGKPFHFFKPTHLIRYPGG